ncbi:MAG TPA: hypothetical protein VMN99_08125 [Anaerolineales bacterium]|nr:hypothetical protein [Anaerolineales bacterium]
MPLRPWKTVLFIGLFLLLVLTLSIYSQLELPAPGGSYAVGRTAFHWVDTARPEVLTEDPSDFREVAAMVWYPAEAGSGVKAGYFPNLPSVSDALMQSGEVKWWEVFGLRFIRSESPFDADPVKAEHPFPVVIFSPGNGTNIEFYASLASEIASHGYIVLGLNHPYDVPAVQLSNGEVAPYDKSQWAVSAEEHQAYIMERIKVRVADVSYALEQLDKMNSTGLLAGIMDLDSVAAAGHSLGGITASEACKADARFKACLNFDGLQKGGPFSMEVSATPPEQPFLFLTKESQLHPRLLERFESMPESYWVVVHGASHQSFTDGPLLQPSLLPGANRADQFMELIQHYTLAFLDHVLRGQSSNSLAQPADGNDVSVKVFPTQ